MLHFQLFRIKVRKPAQMSLLYPEEPSASILDRAIAEKPSAELRKGHVWHVGNLARLDENGLYFALGRTTSSIVERYDEDKRDFVEEAFETAPYTHVVVDLNIGLCAIAAKPKLAPKVPGTARQLGRVLDSSQIAAERGLRFDIAEINDPKNFIAYLQTAYAIRWFSMTFSSPNPWDVDQDFHRPLQRFLKEASGDQGRTSVSGAQLDARVLETVARSAAASGNDAEAKIEFEEGGERVRKRLRGNPATIDEKGLDSEEERKGFLTKIRALYDSIRQRAKGGEG